MRALVRVLGPTPRDFALRVGAPLLFFVAFIALWQLAVTEGWVDELILPAPADLASAFGQLVTGSLVWPHFFATLWETVAGFIIGSALGILLAVASSLSVVLRQMLYPYVVALQVTPRIALAPIIIAWLGFGYTPKIVLAATIVFFPVFINALTGMVAVDREAVEMFRSMGASRRQTFLHLRLPSALPVTLAGLKTGVTLALIGAIVGEFISAEQGLGLLLQQFTFQVNMADAMAVLLLLTLMGFLLYGAMEYLDRALVFWSHDGRMTARTQRRARRAQRGGDEDAGKVDAGGGDHLPASDGRRVSESGGPQGLTDAAHGGRSTRGGA